MLLHTSMHASIHFVATDDIVVNASLVGGPYAEGVYCVHIGGYPSEVMLYMTADQMSKLVGQLQNAVCAALDKPHHDAADADRDTSDPFDPVP